MKFSEAVWLRDKQNPISRHPAPSTVSQIPRAPVWSAFGAARREGLIDDNPAERVAVLKKKKKSDSGHRAFTLPELKQLLKVADDEWRGMILFGFYIGQRLGDIADITRQKLELKREEVKLRTDKTDRLQILPLAAPLLKYVKRLRLGYDPRTPLFPRAFAIVERQGRTGNLSNQFHRILVAAGLAKKRSHHSTGEGRSTMRELSEISFHSLRHTATSQL